MGEGGVKVFVGLEYSGSPMKTPSKFSQHLLPRTALEICQCDGKLDGISVLGVPTIYTGHKIRRCITLIKDRKW